jgi:hypothetical protein
MWPEMNGKISLINLIEIPSHPTAFDFFDSKAFMHSTWSIVLKANEPSSSVEDWEMGICG